jgi:acetoin utilization deacetylase AcuC-like enzyme
MEKYRMLREGVAALGRDLLLVPEPATDTDLLRVHDADYVARVSEGRLDRSEIRRIGFPWSHELVERSRRSVGGTMAAARAALVDGVAANLAGGTHHAFAHRGEGFCVFNDVAVAVRALQADGQAARAAVVDLDVHQGNGTAAIFRGDATVFTASVHGANNFPFRKEDGDLDVELPDGTGDGPFLDAVSLAVDAALKARPDIVFYLAGADAHEGDRLGRLAVSREGLARRDELVLDAFTARGIPVAVVMAGGYGTRVEDTVEIHLASISAAARRGPRETRA